MPRLGPALAAGLGLALAACAGPRLAPEAERALPARIELEEVPFHAQADGHCGPAALATVLNWSGLAATPEGVAEIAFTPGRGGTLQSDVLGTVRRAGRLGVPVRSLDGLLAELAAGHPVLVLQNLGLAWHPVWHYAVAVGYDLEAEAIVLRSGLEARRRIGLSTFARTWARADEWGLVVLAPDRLPATAGERDAVRAAAGLERAGHAAGAAVAYATILQRWPTSLAARIGLANARYAGGDLQGAEQVLRATVLIHPDSAAAWNNLAHLQAERGDHGAALAAARRAAGLDGDDPAIRATLAGLEAGAIRD